MLRIFAIICLSWWTGIYAVQDFLLFPNYLAPAPLRNPPYRNTEIFTTAIDTGGHTEAWFIPAPQASDQHPAPTVIYFHGNAELIDYQSRVVAGYHAMGCNILLVEYRGYGHSSGQPSQAALKHDATTFLAQLRQRPDVRQNHIFYHGRSLGGAVAADLTATHPPKLLVLESTFRSAYSIAGQYGAPRFIIKNPFDTESVLSDFDRPVLIMHGTNDQTIPVAHARYLRDHTPKPTYREFPSDHNDLPGAASEQEYWTTIRDFLTDHRIIGPSNNLVSSKDQSPPS